MSFDIVSVAFLMVAAWSIGCMFTVSLLLRTRKLGNLIVDYRDEDNPEYYISVDTSTLSVIPKKGIVVLSIDLQE